MRNLLIIFFLFSSLAGYCQEAEGVSNPVHINFNTRESNAPDIFMVYRNSGTMTPLGMVEVNFRILDDSGISELSVNEKVVTVTSQDTIVLSYEFSPGQEVTVMAKDRFDNVREKSFIVQSQKLVTVTPTSAKNRFYALIIGVDEYQDPKINALSDPINDATQLKKILTERYTFEENNITFLKNPTYADLIITFDNLSRDIGPGDLLLIFYAGHGYYNEKTNIGYWLPSDAQESNTVKWFRNSALVENIGAINSKHTLLISDACFSGSIFKTRSAFNNASIDISNMLKQPSRKAMTSGSLTTVPDKSVFMKYLLKTLSENENKYLPSEDLFDTIRSSMRNNSNTRPLFGEIQNVGDEGGNFVFIRKD